MLQLSRSGAAPLSQHPFCRVPSTDVRHTATAIFLVSHLHRRSFRRCYLAKCASVFHQVSAAGFAEEGAGCVVFLLVVGGAFTGAPSKCIFSCLSQNTLRLGAVRIFATTFIYADVRTFWAKHVVLQLGDFQLDAFTFLQILLHLVDEHSFARSPWRVQIFCSQSSFPLHFPKPHLALRFLAREKVCGSTNSQSE